MSGGVPDTRFGFVAILGAPNVGKSTLVNRFVGAKVTIVSPKVQTTRSRMLGIAIQGQSQIVFVDTPGIFAPRKRLDRAMVAAAWKGAADADLMCLLVDCARGFDEDTRRIAAELAALERSAVLVLNKIDRVKRESLLALSAALNAAGKFQETFMVSALNGDGVGDLLAYFARMAPPGVWHFPEDQISDLPQRLLAAEVTREKLYLETHQELPYALTVVTDAWEQFRDGSVKVTQTIFVERESQRAIVLGKGGQMIKRIGAAAREDVAAMLGCKVHLFLHVKVREKWSEQREHYAMWGLDYDA
ncbi:MAG: GTPase Era [Alphaproteobacteria bacterium]